MYSRLKISTVLMVILAGGFGLSGCKTTPKKEVLAPGAIQGFAHFDKEGSVSTIITDNTIKFYRTKTQAFVKDGECENFQGASGVICYDRAKNIFKQDGKTIGKFAPFKSERPKTIKAKPTSKPASPEAASVTTENAPQATSQPEAKPTPKPTTKPAVNG